MLNVHGRPAIAEIHKDDCKSIALLEYNQAEFTSPEWDSRRDSAIAVQDELALAAQTGCQALPGLSSRLRSVQTSRQT
jgi:hypothetical protein